MSKYRRGILVHPEELTKEWIDWMSEAGLNTLGLHPVGGINAHESLQRAIDAHTLPATRRLHLEAKARGIEVEYEAHAMRWLMPKHLMSVVPEWFRMNEKGERADDFNLCASNAEALAYVSERTATLAKLLDTGAQKYFYWLDDAASGSCHCPECRRLSASDQQMKIINAMLAGLKKVNPAAKLCFLAYYETLSAPRKVEPLDGVFLEYAPMRRDHHRPIADPGCEKNVMEVAPLKDLLSCFGTKDSRVLEYWMDNSKFSGWTKPPKAFTLDEAVMERDVEFYDSMGFETITSFGCYLGPDYQALHGLPPVKRYGEILKGK